MTELEEDWSHADAVDAHVMLDVLDQAELASRAPRDSATGAPGRRPGRR